MKYKIIAIGLLSTLTTFQAFAQARVPDIAIPPRYFNICYESIVAESLSSRAMKPVEDTEKVYQRGHEAIINSIQENLDEIGTAFSNELSRMAMQIEITAQNQRDMRIEMLSAAQEEELALRQRTNEIENYMDNARFPVNFYNEALVSELPPKNSAEWRYYAQKCYEEKANEINNEQTAQANNLILNTTINLETVNRERTANARTTMLERTQYLRETYCSEEDAQNGICSEPSETPYANLSAEIFINPAGYPELNQSVGSFKTLFTYSEIEEFTSLDFIDSIKPIFPIRPPRTNELQDRNKQEFIALYNNNIGALNLANQSFNIAREQRVAMQKIPLTVQDGVNLDNLDNELLESDNQILMPVSFYDNIRYLINQAQDPKTIEVLNASNNKTIIEHIYRSNIMNAKLNLEILKQQERIQNLEAAILSISHNSREEIEYLEQIQ